MQYYNCKMGTRVSSVFLVFILMTLSTTAKLRKIKIKDESKTINSTCEMGNSGIFGTCKRINDCFAKGLELRLDACYFEKDKPIVCCPDDEIPEVEEIITTTTPFPKQNYYDVIEKRCEEYYDTQIYIDPCFGIRDIPAQDEEYPHMAAIGWRNGSIINFKCGGILIETNYVLTAAHCVKDTPNIVRLGGLKNTNNMLSDDDIEISEIHIHPDYNPDFFYNDIAILKLVSNANETTSKLACLWHRDLIENTYLVSVGFEGNSFGSSRSDVLITANLTFYDNEVCEEKYPVGSQHFPKGILESQLCAGVMKGDVNICAAHSGGPIGIKRWNGCWQHKHVPFVMGMSSFGEGCDNQKVGVYSRITSYLDWIVKTVWPQYLEEFE